jgi:intracellular multiplication protein IcmP
MSGGNEADNGLWMLFFIILIPCAMLWGIWYAFKPQVLQGYIWVRSAEFAVASLWTDDDYTVRITTPQGTQPMTFAQARQFIRTADPQNLKDNGNLWSLIHATSLAALKPMRWLIGGIFLLLAGLVLFRGPTSHHRSKFSLQKLITKQAQTFPAIAPMIEFNPLTDVAHRSPGDLVPAELPLFAEALSPEEWVAFHKVPIPDGKVDRNAMEKALKKQLGERWRGPKKLKPYQQVLLACFALKAARKRNEADDLLGELSQSWNHKGGLNLSGTLVRKARKIIGNKSLSAETLSVCNHHGYVVTALLGALNLARSEGGVLAPAQFLWLRGHDRNLWYPLNNLGRQSYHAEAVGAMSHFRAERQVKRPIPKPMLKDAVDVLSGYLEDNQRSAPIPQLDFSMIKNHKAPQKNKGVMKPVGT